MEPSIRSYDILFTEHISPRTGNLSRGDIIVARSPNNPSTFICKRIVALPEDHLLQADGTLQHVRKYSFNLIKSNQAKSNYLSLDNHYILLSIQVPKGHVWIEGDNADNSTDSRNYGPIPIGLVRGRAMVRVWPFVDATFLTPRKNAPAS